MMDGSDIEPDAPCTLGAVALMGQLEPGHGGDALSCPHPDHPAGSVGAKWASGWSGGVVAGTHAIYRLARAVAHAVDRRAGLRHQCCHGAADGLCVGAL